MTELQGGVVDAEDVSPSWGLPEWLVAGPMSETRTGLHPGSRVLGAGSSAVEMVGSGSEG